MVDPLIIGIGSAILAAVLTLFIPVNVRRVNQNLIAIVIAVLVFTAAFALFDLAMALGVGIAGTAVALTYRGLVRWVKAVLWRNFIRYTTRDYWYTRVGRTVVGGGRRRRRRDG